MFKKVVSSMEKTLVLCMCIRHSIDIKFEELYSPGLCLEAG